MTTRIQTRLRALLVPFVGAVLACVLAFTAVSMTGVVPGSAAYASPPDAHAGGLISRATVLARGNTWVRARVPYNQHSHYEGYRQDCSGFVSMAWDLTSSRVTWTLPAVSTRLVSTSQLLPGDILDWPHHHVVLFVGWNSADHGRHRYFDLYEETPPRARASHHGDIRDFSSYTPYRYKNIR